MQCCDYYIERLLVFSWELKLFHHHLTNHKAHKTKCTNHSLQQKYVTRGKLGKTSIHHMTIGTAPDWLKSKVTSRWHESRYAKTKIESYIELSTAN